MRARAAIGDALDDLESVGHGPGGAIPFGEHEHVARAESVDRLLKLGPSLGAFAGRLLGEDGRATGLAERGDLPVEILVLCRDPGVADQHVCFAPYLVSSLSY